MEGVISRSDVHVSAGKLYVGAAVNGVVGRVNTELSARKLHQPVALQAVVLRSDAEAPAADLHSPAAVDAVAPRREHKLTGVDIHKALGVFEIQGIVPCVHRDRRAAEIQRVIGMQAILRGADRQRPAGDDQIVVDGNTVQSLRRDRETAAAVDGQVVVGEDHPVRAVGQGCLGIGAAAGHAVVRSFRQGQKDLVCLIDAQAGVIPAAQLRAVQQQPDLGALFRVDDDAAALQRTAEDIVPGAADDNIPVVKIRTAARNRGRIPGERDDRGSPAVPVAPEIVGGEVCGTDRPLGIRVHQDLYAEAFAVDKQDRQQQDQQKNRNADQVNGFMR